MSQGIAFLAEKKYENNKYPFILRDVVLTKENDSKLHWHDFFEFEIILSGRASHIYNGEKFEICEGDAYLMAYHSFHEVHPYTELKLISLQFDEKLLHEELRLFLKNNYYVLKCSYSKDEISYLKILFEKLKREDKFNDTFSDIRVQEILSEIVILLLRKLDMSSPRVSPNITQSVISLINSNFTKNISVASVAETLSITPNYLSSTFVKHTGYTFTKYLNLVRLRYACHLLANSQVTIKEVAEASGYASVEYFNAVFKKTFNLTPMQYRIDNTKTKNNQT